MFNHIKKLIPDMKTRHQFISSLACLAAVFSLNGCTDDTGRVVYPYSCPEISDFSVSIGNEMQTASSMTFSLSVKDKLTPLSTLEVSVTAGEEEIYAESIRTKGKEADIENHEIFLPFTVNQQDNQSAKLTLTAINVEGSPATVEHEFTLKRPAIPATIYLHYDDQVVPMHQDAGNPCLYATAVGTFPTSFTGKVSTAASLDDSPLIWGYSEATGAIDLVAAEDAGFTFNYPDWQVEQVTFNVLTFQVGAEGEYQVLTVNGTELATMGEYYQASIDFEEGGTVTITGIDDLEHAYNRDFLEYDAASQTCTFIRESGTWEVYYYPKYNYLWIVRSDDVAPNAFWLIGHGFTSAPVWNTDLDTDGGWNSEDIAHMGYAVRTGEHTYQTTLYLSDTHEWGSFEIEIYSDRVTWGKDQGMLLQEGSLLGDATGFAISQSNGFTNAEGFTPGYYRLTFDTSAGVGHETMYIERIGD